MPIRALIFDMDGTMCDSMPFHDAAWTQFLRGRGVEVDVDRFLRDTAGMRNVEIVCNYLGRDLSDDAARAVGGEKEALFRTMYAPHLVPVPGLHAALDWADAQGLRLALATSADHDNVVFTLRALALDDRFEVIVHSADVRRGKPHPDCFLLAAERLGLAPGECLVVEDSAAGIEAARRADMPVAVIMTALDRAALQRIQARADDDPHAGGAASRLRILASAPTYETLDLPAALQQHARQPSPT